MKGPPIATTSLRRMIKITALPSIFFSPNKVPTTSTIIMLAITTTTTMDSFEDDAHAKFTP